MSTLFEVTCPKTGDLVMVAPMNTIAFVFDLAPGAVARIYGETLDAGGVCDIHFNYGRTKLGYSTLNVALAEPLDFAGRDKREDRSVREEFAGGFAEKE